MLFHVLYVLVMSVLPCSKV